MLLDTWCLQSTPPQPPPQRAASLSCAILTGAELPQATKSLNSTTFPVTIAVGIPVLVGIARVLVDNCANSMCDPHWNRASRGYKKSCVCAHGVVSDTCISLRSCGLWPARLLCLGDSPGKNTRVGCHTLLEHHIPCCPSHRLP